MKRPEILFIGDPHGDLRFLVRAIERAARKPDAVVLLGDLEAPADIVEWFEPLRALGVQVRFIVGNHDTDSPQLWRNLVNSPYWAWNLEGRVETIAGVRIAGLGGIFRGKIWLPPDEPRFSSYGEWEASLAPAWMKRPIAPDVERVFASERLTHSSTIFPDTIDAMAALEADVLVTHEAPQGHPLGFAVLDDLADAMGVQRLFHGHHHERRVYPPVGERLAFGVGMREIVGFNGEIIATPTGGEGAR